MSIIQNVARKLKASAKGIVDALSVSDEELQQEVEEYERYIVPHFTYFNELDEPGQERFLQRVFLFQKKKFLLIKILLSNCFFPC